jgi:hypothetical protein
MQLKPVLKYLFSASFILAVSSCALIVAPTGGPRDTTPPKVEKEIPVSKTTSFSENKITLKFDEYIQLKDAEDQIVISPPLETRPEFEISSKSLNIIFRAPLKPNTTYTINFGNSIADNHEANILVNYSYVFSTGASIDSLSISGSVYNSFNNKPEKGLSICLYPIDSFIDSTIYHKTPYYFTKTTEGGFFAINNLPSQTFKLIVFKDDNKNLKYNKNEPIGFYSTDIYTADTVPLKHIFFFKPDPYTINHVLDTFSRETGVFTFVIHKPVKKDIKPVVPVEYYTWYKKGKDDIDSLFLFSGAWKSDSILFTLPNQSSPVLIKPRRTNKTPKFEVSVKKDIELNDSILISFNHPYKAILQDTLHIKLKEDSIVIKPSFIEDKNREKIQIYYPWKEKVKYSLEIKDSAITDIYGQYNKKSKTSWLAKGIKDYSSLNLSFVHPGDNEQYIIQLTNETETKIFREFILTGSATYNIEYIVPGKYIIKIIRDINKNGKWDNGDYQLKRQPEKVFFYNEVLTLRAYWDLEQTIDLKKIVD